MPFISMHNISKTFGGVKALNQVDLRLNDGEALCLCGQNGCGKSTLIKILSGVYQPDSGAEIRIGSTLHTQLSPKTAIEQGIQVIYQDLALFPNLSVAENIAINHYRQFGFVKPKAIRDIAQNALDSINATLDLTANVEDLPIAQQQLVAICRALAQNARLLIMDEPTASLTAHEVHYLLDIVLKLKSKGISIIFVSHRLKEVLTVSDTVLVLKDGSKVGEYPIQEVDEKRLTFLMTGLTLHQKRLDPPDFLQTPTVLEVKNLCLAHQYQQIDFSLKQGEIISLVGLLGSGRTELCLSLFGITQPDCGEIRLNGQRISLKNNRQAIAKGIVYVSEDRMNTGLIMAESIHHNIISTVLQRLTGRFNIIQNQSARRLSQTFIEKLKIKAADADLAVNTLSGGNAQRVSIAKWLAVSPQVMILDSPTIGVDVANKTGIFHIIQTLSEKGISVIFITDEIEEAYYHSHRVFVMNKGKITAQFRPNDCTEQAIEDIVYEKSK